MLYYEYKSLHTGSRVSYLTTCMYFNRFLRALCLEIFRAFDTKIFKPLFHSLCACIMDCIYFILPAAQKIAPFYWVYAARVEQNQEKNFYMIAPRYFIFCSCRHNTDENTATMMRQRCAVVAISITRPWRIIHDPCNPAVIVAMATTEEGDGAHSGSVLWKGAGLCFLLLLLSSSSRDAFFR